MSRESTRELADVFIDRQAHIPAQLLDDFLLELRRLGISIELRESEPRTYAGIEYYLPTAVVIYIATTFVSNFLGEAGKDAYKSLKRAITTLFQKVGPLRTRVVHSGQFKIDSQSPYSRILSVYYRDANGRRYKFLIPAHASEDAYADAADALIAFLQRRPSAKMQRTEKQGNSQLDLITYDVAKKQWRLMSETHGTEHDE